MQYIMHANLVQEQEGYLVYMTLLAGQALPL